MRRHLALAVGILAALAFSNCSHLTAQENQARLTEKEVVDLIKHSKGNLKDAAAVIERREVDFDLDAKVEQKLRKAGADDDTIQSIWKVTPNGRASQKSILSTATGAKLEIPPKEGMGFQTIQAETDPDRRIRMVDEFERNFPNSQILPYVYVQGAEAWQKKGDLKKAVEFGEKGLRLDPENLPALLVVVTSLAQPSMLNGSDSEKTTRSAKVESDANHALKLIAGMAKSPEESDEQFQKRKGEMEGDAHFSLGMVALLSENPPKAVEEFKTATKVNSTAPPQYFYRLGEAYSEVGKKADAIEAFQKAAQLGRGTVIEQMANQQVTELKK